MSVHRSKKRTCASYIQFDIQQRDNATRKGLTFTRKGLTFSLSVEKDLRTACSSKSTVQITNYRKHKNRYDNEDDGGRSDIKAGPYQRQQSSV